MKIATRVAIGSTSVLILVGGVVATQLQVINRLAAGQRDLGRGDLPVITAAVDVLEQRDQLEELIRKYFVTRDDAYAEAASRTAREIHRSLLALAALDPVPDDPNAVPRLVTTWSDFPLTGVGPEDAARSLSGSGVLEPHAASLRVPMDAVHAGVTGLLASARSRVEGQLSEARAAAGRTRRLSVTAFAFVLVLSVGVIAATVVSIDRPIRSLVAATGSVAEGRFGHRVEVRGSTELSELAERFNVMVDRLDELDRLKRSFLSNISHEIKSPLVAMQETSRLLLEEQPGPLTDSQRRLLELHADGERRLARMIGDLLDLSRIDAGVLEYAFAPESPAEIATAAVELQSPAAARRGLRIDLEVHRPAPSLVCDRGRVLQVLQNLLENASRFQPADEPITVRVAAASDGRGATFAVIDRGPGIPAAERHEIFDRFRQGSGPRTSANVGLGLAVCREIVDAHGGEIAVEDTPGGGATFLVSLLERPPGLGAHADGTE